jgi:hypothetical protein
MKYKIEFNENINEYTISELINMIKQNPNIIYYKFIDNNKIKINNNFVLNTQFILHRINKIDELKNLNEIFGLEFDIRDDNFSNELILAHDPFVNGDNLECFLKEYKHKTLIFNIKSERVELKCLELIQKYNITDYFFLDSSFPMIYLLNKKYNINNIASRYSEYEPLNFTENIKDFIKWIWIDCFTKLPLDADIYKNIKKINKKICIVSPELQGQSDKISQYRNQLIDDNIIPDSICCKEYNIINWI